MTPGQAFVVVFLGLIGGFAFVVALAVSRSGDVEPGAWLVTILVCSALVAGCAAGIAAVLS